MKPVTEFKNGGVSMAILAEIDILRLILGLVFFLYGMHVMSSNLEKMAGGKLEQLLKKATANPIVSLMLGAAITIAVQSSSAVTVMLVGLVNSGIMQFGQTIGVIFGANIGTTLTAWILSLSGLGSDNLVLQMMKPENFSLAFALLGILMIMMSKKRRRQDIGKILVGEPAGVVGHIIQDGAGGHTAAYGEKAGLEKLPEKLQIDHFPAPPLACRRIPARAETTTKTTGLRFRK